MCGLPGHPPWTCWFLLGFTFTGGGWGALVPKAQSQSPKRTSLLQNHRDLCCEGFKAAEWDSLGRGS